MSTAPTAVTNLVQIRPWEASLQMDEMLGKRFIYSHPFSGTHLQVTEVRPVDGFSRLMAQTTWTSARMCLLGVS